jgi:hypothetical protein
MLLGCSSELGRAVFLNQPVYAAAASALHAAAVQAAWLVQCSDAGQGPASRSLPGVVVPMEPAMCDHSVLWTCLVAPGLALAAAVRRKAAEQRPMSHHYLERQESTSKA